MGALEFGKSKINIQIIKEALAKTTVIKDQIVCRIDIFSKLKE